MQDFVPKALFIYGAIATTPAIAQGAYTPAGLYSDRRDRRGTISSWIGPALQDSSLRLDRMFVAQQQAENDIAQVLNEEAIVTDGRHADTDLASNTRPARELPVS